MADINSKSLNADKQTQKLTASSTVNQYNYALGSQDYAKVTSNAIFDSSFGSRNDSVELCINKLDALRKRDLKQSDIDNCLGKLKAVYKSLLQH